MNLLQLPTEILLLILRLLGPGFFHHDTRRLMVSKWWYELARLVLLRDLQFSAKSLPRFLRTDMSSLVHQHTRTIDIAFDGVQDRRAVLSASPDVRERMVSDWTTNVANDLTSLAAILQDCRNLRSLKLKPRPKWRARSVFLRTYFSSDALVPLLSVSHLTCLEFDTVCTGIGGASSRPGSHICENISALLPTLRRLRCRMRKICPRILKPPGEGTISSLEEVIINLNLGDLSQHALPQHSYRCGIFVPGLSSTWKADMELGAKELVNRMATPRVVKVLSRSVPGPQMECFDAIAQRRMMLAPGAAWEVDGEVVEETTADEGS
ncbi:hypothetical protein B0J15DRAFT_233003 [Fusarium solani]|uniref:F-box domain-containing protein n=1 Tax=Fusarium solani TaxID=169388 RepID=A0A9P9KUP6_FUSSL|nr:uncharacterized protein B0J15DRAFT_233003 [Fusarium solani]KAH7268804.1 hypothetical protein B0J15DRAFT_233003 [Fusarium solani]